MQLKIVEEAKKIEEQKKEVIINNMQEAEKR